MSKKSKEERRLEYVPLRSLRPAKRNPKDHDLGLINTSVARFGYVEPVVMDERTGRLVAGHGRVQALMQMQKEGADPPAGVKVDANQGWLVPVMRGWASRSDSEAEGYLLASNRSSEVGGWDEAGLAAVLKDLAEADALDGTGYDAADVDRLLKQAAPTEEPTSSKSDPLASVWQVLIECGDESQQEELISRLEREGLKCRPLIF